MEKRSLILEIYDAHLLVNPDKSLGDSTDD